MPVTAKTQSSSAAVSHLSLVHQCSVYHQADVKPILHVNYPPFLQSIHRSSTDVFPTDFNASNRPHAQSGFTLVEIIVVVVILSVFAGVISLSVGSSESRKNRAFYEHLTDSLSYVRLLSSERAQPMGLSLRANNQGQVTPVIVTLSNPYITYQAATASSGTRDSIAKNAMELSADISTMSAGSEDDLPTPSWDVEPEISLPELPNGVSLRVQRLASNNASSIGQGRVLQPWFTDQTVPQVLWFGTGQATPVTIEVLHDSRLVGEVIAIMPDGSMMIGQGG